MNECERCHRIVQEDLRFINGRNIRVCRDCASAVYTRCKCCGGYCAGEDIRFLGKGGAMCIWCASERYVICSHCRDYVKEKAAVEFHGQLMCRDCRDAYFSRCGCCQARFETTELFDATDKSGNAVKVCLNCLHEKFHRCAGCGSWVSRQADHCESGGKIFCRDCCELCENCGKLVPCQKLETISTTDGCREVCPACRASFGECAFCGYDRPKDKLHEIMGEQYCEDCLPEYLAQLEDGERARAVRLLDATLAGGGLGWMISGRRETEPDTRPEDDDFSDDREAQFDDGYPEDYVGDGLDGADDYVGDGLDGADDLDDDDA